MWGVFNTMLLLTRFLPNCPILCHSPSSFCSNDALWITKLISGQLIKLPQYSFSASLAKPLALHHLLSPSFFRAGLSFGLQWPFLLYRGVHLWGVPRVWFLSPNFALCIDLGRVVYLQLPTLFINSQVHIPPSLLPLRSQSAFGTFVSIDLFRSGIWSSADCLQISPPSALPPLSPLLGTLKGLRFGSKGVTEANFLSGKTFFMRTESHMAGPTIHKYVDSMVGALQTHMTECWRSPFLQVSEEGGGFT